MWKKTPLAVSRGLRSKWILIFSIWIYFSSGSLLGEEYKKRLHLKPSIPHRSIDGSISGRSVCFTSKRKTADKGNCWRFLGGRFGEGRGQGAILKTKEPSFAILSFVVISTISHNEHFKHRRWRRILIKCSPAINLPLIETVQWFCLSDMVWCYSGLQI